MLTMAPTPQQMDPKFYELAFQLTAAIIEIVANPAVLAKAEQARALAHQLSDEQVEAYREAMSVIAQAGDISARAAAQAQRNQADQAANLAEAKRLQAAFEEHDANIAALNAAQKKATAREARLIEREHLADGTEMAQLKIAEQQEKEAARLLRLDAALKKREDALQGLANTLSNSAPKEGVNGSAAA